MPHSTRAALPALVIASVILTPPPALSQPLYVKPEGAVTRWASFENLKGTPGRGGMENKGGKGHAYDSLQPGETRTLMEADGPGRITRIWMTIDDRSTQTLRSLRLSMYWDGATSPAVCVPLGDFFGATVHEPVRFENEFFASPEGRSFNCFIPMPFRRSARVQITNDSDRRLGALFYDIDYVLGPAETSAPLYFHAVWRRENPTQVGKDFEILPRTEGKGRFLGTNLGLIRNRLYPGWWGEGEVKIYLEDDREFPTLVGTGTEDYIGTGWGQGVYVNRFQGCLVADEERGLFSFYRYHVPDPVYFDRAIRVTIQQMGGDGKSNVIQALKDGKVPLQPVTIADGETFHRLLDSPQPVDLEKHPSSAEAWTNYYRQDDVCAIALFYLDRPEGTQDCPPSALRVQPTQ